MIAGETQVLGIWKWPLNNRRLPRICSPVCIGLLGLLLQQVAMAGELGGGLVVSPTRIEARLVSHQTLPPVMVYNGGGQPVEVSAYLGPGGHDENGMPLYEEGPPTGYPIKLLPRRFRLPPGGSQKVELMVGDVSQLQGGIYPIVYFEFHRVGSRNAGPIPRLAVLTLLTGQTEEKQGEVVDFAIEQDKGGRVSFIVLGRNTGTIHFKTAGFVHLFGKEFETILELPRKVILPRCRRRLTVTSDHLLPEGEYVAEMEILAGTEPMGRRRIEFSIREGRIAECSSRF